MAVTTKPASKSIAVGEVLSSRLLTSANDKIRSRLSYRGSSTTETLSALPEQTYYQFIRNTSLRVSDCTPKQRNVALASMRHKSYNLKQMKMMNLLQLQILRVLASSRKWTGRRSLSAFSNCKIKSERIPLVSSLTSKGLSVASKGVSTRQKTDVPKSAQRKARSLLQKPSNS